MMQFESVYLTIFLVRFLLILILVSCLFLVCCRGLFQLHCTNVLIQSDCYDTLALGRVKKKKLNTDQPS